MPLVVDTLRNRLCVVLVSTRNPLNLGAAARAMSNFGFFDLRVVNPYEASFREARSAVGASEVLAKAREHTSVAGAVADCTLVVGTTAAARREIQHPLRSLNQCGKSISKATAPGRVALLFGSEKRGLSNEDLSHCHWLLRIPTREVHGSMNLGQAVAVCLYELVRGAAPSSHAKKLSRERRQPSSAKRMENQIKRQQDAASLATSGELERLTTTLMDALRVSNYLDRHASAAADEKVRRLVRRLKLSTSDAELLLSMLRKMLWKIQSAL